MKDEDYVDFEKAKMLKQLKFDWKIRHQYNNKDLSESIKETCNYLLNEKDN